MFPLRLAIAPPAAEFTFVFLACTYGGDEYGFRVLAIVIQQIETQITPSCFLLGITGHLLKFWIGVLNAARWIGDEYSYWALFNSAGKNAHLIFCNAALASFLGLAQLPLNGGYQAGISLLVQKIVCALFEQAD